MQLALHPMLINPPSLENSSRRIMLSFELSTKLDFVGSGFLFQFLLALVSPPPPIMLVY